MSCTPLWDVHFETWTAAAVASGINVRQTDFSTALSQVSSGNATLALTAGHRRLEAAKLIGWREIAAVVRDETDANRPTSSRSVENLQREDLTPKEEATCTSVDACVFRGERILPYSPANFCAFAMVGHTNACTFASS